MYNILSDKLYIHFLISDVGNHDKFGNINLFIDYNAFPVYEISVTRAENWLADECRATQLG